jgi:hypothetical protein
MCSFTKAIAISFHTISNFFVHLLCVLQNTEIAGTVRAAEAVMEVCIDTKDWKLVNEHILILSKRRSQMKQVRTDIFCQNFDALVCLTNFTIFFLQMKVIIKVVQMAMDVLAQDPSPLDKPTTIELIETLRAVSQGKVSPIKIVSFVCVCVGICQTLMDRSFF